MRFRGVVELGGKTATGIEVPEEVVAGLGSHKRPPVRVTIGEFTYRSTVARMGGRFLLPVSAEVRKGAGVAAGDEIDVDGARPRFDGLNYTARKEAVRGVEEAKAAVTRERRIAKVVDGLRG